MELIRISRSPWLTPGAAILVTALVLAANPAREPVLQSLLGRLPEGTRLIPLAPGTLIPTLFAKWLWGCALFAGCGWLAAEKVRGGATASWRVLVYGVTSLVAYTFFGLILWTTTLGWWTASRWFSDAVQGWFLLAFVFSYTWAVICGVRWWMRDIGQRCPECLESLRMPLESGRECDVLIEPGELESVCLRGHGAMSQTRWDRSFRPATGFWKQLL